MAESNNFAPSVSYVRSLVSGEGAGEIMRKIRIRDLDDWPPESGGAFGKGEILRVPPSEATMSTLGRVAGRKVMFGCLFGGREHSYDYEAKSWEIAEQLADIIKKNIGQSLFSLGDSEIEQGDD
jgi:hypothetical protein